MKMKLIRVNSRHRVKARHINHDFLSTQTNKPIEPASNETNSKPKLHRWIRYIVLFLSVAIGTGIIGFIFNVKETKNNLNHVDHPYAEYPIHNDSEDYISRAMWGAMDLVPSKLTKLEPPVNLVIIAHTVGSTCDTSTACMQILRNMENVEVYVKYNFLLGYDGNIYEGRGWEYCNFLNISHSISVGLFGNYEKVEMDEIQVSALNRLLDYGVANNKLSPDFKIVGHNQVMATVSPGKNVMKVIKKLERYQPVNYRKM